MARADPDGELATSRADRRAELEAAIAAQEALRPTLGDAVVDVTVSALRAQLEALRAPPADGGPRGAASASDRALARLQRFLPAELADKMRATERIESERKQVTVLFADIAGFTALSERLDPEEVALVTNEALRDLAEAVYQYEGYIDKFVGDAVMAVFGAPVAHEDDPERALRAALAMRERLEQFNRQWVDRLGQPLQLHIGVNTGPVIAGNVGPDLRLAYTVMGDTVNTAARLEDAARPGQILVSGDTQRLAREAFTFRPLEPIRVKGKRAPVAVFELQRARLHPGKARGLQGLGRAFVGRDAECAELRAVAAELDGGRGRTVLIEGEAGIGKSRLMAEWRAELGERARWLEGRSFAHTTALAYGPFLDLLRRYAGIADDESEAQARARLDAVVARMYPGRDEARAIFASMLGMRLGPDEAGRLADLPAEDLRRRLFTLVEDALARLAGERPTWLVFEDVHWADQATIDLVEHLLPLTGRLPLAVVGVSRPNAEGPAARLKAAAAAHDAERVTRISLAPLPDSASLAMVEGLLQTPELPGSLKSLIVGKAEGNPFFVEELIRALIERGALVRAEGGDGWTVTPLIERVSVPDTVHGLLMARLDRLPDEARRVVQQAAVIGRVFLYRVLARLADNGDGLDADLGHLEREELVRRRARLPEIEYVFKHALTQEVAYQSLLAPRRRELHRKVGEAMEALFADRIGEFSAILTDHFLRGEVWDRAVNYFTLAGDAAARLYARAEARTHYAQALEAMAHLPDGDEARRRRIDTVVKLVEVALAADTPEQTLARLAETELQVQSLAGPDGLADQDRLRLARVHFWMGRAHYLRNAPREAIGFYRQVLAVAQEFGDEDLLAIPSSVIGRALNTQGQFGKSGPFLERAIAPLEKAGNWPEWILTLAYLGVSLAARGHYVEGVTMCRRALARAIETNNLNGIAGSRLILSIVHMIGGDWERMHEESTAGLAVAEQAADHVYVYLGLGLRSWAEGRVGLHEAAAKTGARFRALVESLGRQLLLADLFAAGQAEIALLAGRVEEALATAEGAVNAARAINNVYAEGLAERTWGEALTALDPPRRDEAESHLAASLRALEAGEAHLPAAFTHLAWGQLCRDRGDPAAARDHLAHAAAQLEASGLTSELARVHGILNSLASG